MSTRTRGVGAQHDRRRTEIADAVLAVVAERGLAAVSLSTAATRAGVSPGRVQHYFPSKQRLLEAAFERGNSLSTDRIRDKAGADLDAAEPRTVLAAVLGELIPYDATTRAHLRVRQWFGALALVDEPIAERLRGLYADFHGRFAGLLRREQAAGRIRPGRDAQAEAVALVALTEGLAHYVLIEVRRPDEARAQVDAAIAELYA